MSFLQQHRYRGLLPSIRDLLIDRPIPCPSLGLISKVVECMLLKSINEDLLTYAERPASQGIPGQSSLTACLGSLAVQPKRAGRHPFCHCHKYNVQPPFWNKHIRVTKVLYRQVGAVVVDRPYDLERFRTHRYRSKPKAR